MEIGLCGSAQPLGCTKMKIRTKACRYVTNVNVTSRNRNDLDKYSSFCIGGSKGGVRDGTPFQSNFSFSCSFLGKLTKIIGWRPHHPVWEIPDSPLI